MQQSQSMIDDMGGEDLDQQNSEIDQYPHHIDSNTNDLSTSQMQLMQDSVIEDYNLRTSEEQSVEDSKKQIDFYGQPADYGERYESILSNGANHNL